MGEVQENPKGKGAVKAHCTLFRARTSSHKLISLHLVIDHGVWSSLHLGQP